MRFPQAIHENMSSASNIAGRVFAICQPYQTVIF